MIGTAEITLLLVVATAFLLWAVWVGYGRTRDPMHPVMFLGPLFFLGMVLEPVRGLLNPKTLTFFPRFEGLGFSLLVQYVGMAGLFLGVLSVQSQLPRRMNLSLIDRTFTLPQREQLRSLAWIISAFALIGFWSGIWNSGGFFNAYSFSKGHGVAVSGYLGEAQNLALAALVIYALGCQARQLNAFDFLTGLVMVSPLLIAGTFGGRRGPLFMALVAIVIAYWIARGRVPRPWVIAGAFAVFVVAIVFMQSQRAHLYLGSNVGIRWQEFAEALQGKELEAGDNFVASNGAVIAVSETGDFHFGRQFFINYLVRPIPRQIWPSKYDDTAAFLYGEGQTFDSVSSRHSGWEKILGWHPPNGFSVNSIVDLFMEFSWAYVLATAGLGRLIGLCWRNYRTRGGIWFVLYILVAALSIYLPTQSFRAFALRFLYMSIMMLVIWVLYFGKAEPNRGEPQLRRRRPTEPVPAPSGTND